MSNDTIPADPWARHHAALGPASWGAEATQQIPAVPVEDDRAAFTQGWARPAFTPVVAFGGPQPPPPPLPPVPPTKGHRLRAWLIVVLVLGLILVGAALLAAAIIGPQLDPVAEKAITLTSPQATQKADRPVTKAAPKKVKPVVPAGPVIGKPFQAGDFRFVVHAKKCGLATAGSNPYLKTKAQGSFCRLDVTAENTTDSPAYFNADSLIQAKDAAGREFSADGTANAYGNDPDDAGFYDEVNPGNKVRSFVFFDLPKGAKLASVTFDAGLFTTGKDVTLTF